MHFVFDIRPVESVTNFVSLSNSANVIHESILGFIRIIPVESLVSFGFVGPRSC